MDTSFWCRSLGGLAILVEPEQYSHQLLLARSASAIYYPHLASNKNRWTDVAPFAWNCMLESGKIHSTTTGERRDVSPPVPEHHSTNAD